MPEVLNILAGFTSPIDIGTDPASMLWLFPLVIAVSAVYKATKLTEIKPLNFAKETAMLAGSIVMFVAVAAMSLCLLTEIVT